MMLGRRGTAWLYAASFLFIAACGRRAPEPDGRAAAGPSATPSATAVEPAGTTSAPAAAGTGPASAHPGSRLTWKDPPGWTRLPQTSPMRLATYRVPRESGDPEDGELAVFHFGGGQGGDVEANLARWEKQFSDTKKSDVERTERTVNGLRAHLLTVARGTYTAMMPGQDSTPKSGYALIAAVVETSLGSYFVKLTGPAKTVKARRDAYFALFDSLRVEG
jgi:hypothetical protein